MKLNTEYAGKIRNIIFDFGGVITDIDTAAVIGAFGRLGIPLTAEDIHLGGKPYFAALELGTVSPEACADALRAEFPQARTLSDEQIWTAWNAVLTDFRSERIALLKAVRKNYRIFLLSNINYPNRAELREIYARQFGGCFDDPFEQCFYSDELHLRKPDVRIFRAVLRATGIDPRQTLFIDDRADNFPGAAEAGLQVHHLAPPQTIMELFTAL